MKNTNRSKLVMLALGLTLGVGSASGKAQSKQAQPTVHLTGTGQQIENQYEATLKSLVTDITRSLPRIDPSKKAAVEQARQAVEKAEAEFNAAQTDSGKINATKYLIEHAKGKWIGGAEKGIAQSQDALKKATTDAERQAAKKDLAKWEANKQDGVKVLKEQELLYEKAKIDQPKFEQVSKLAQEKLAKAKDVELAAAKSMLASLDSVLSSDKLDAKLIKAEVLTEGTPLGLAEFAQQSTEKADLLNKLLAEDKLMKEMLVAGGAKFGNYGKAIEIYSEIRKASSKSSEDVLHRLALATSLEHAKPIKQSNPKDQTNGPDTVDPVQRYLHYEKAYLAGELDPAFKTLNTWELRKVVDSDAPDDILAWGRQMMRNYRPDHISNPDYGWRYSSAVKTEVPYGSKNVKLDLDSLQNYQNIVKDGGVCGRRAFFGRFILASFGIPTWGVTQHAHAALSHWTPKGWVVNLGASFAHSWWDKDEVPLSGTQFLLDSQAREHTQDYIKVLRARWISNILGEPAYNERKKIVGGFWSSMAHYEELVLTFQAVTLGPLGAELAEANEPVGQQQGTAATVTTAAQQIVVKNGAIQIPVVAHGKESGKSLTMKSVDGGMQMHCLGGYSTEYSFNAPQAGKYALSARVSTVQEGQKFIFTTNTSKQALEVAVPYTLGMWQQTPPVEVTLVTGRNTLHFQSKEGSRGVSVKDFTLTPMK